LGPLWPLTHGIPDSPDRILAFYEQKPGIFLHELKAALAEHGIHLAQSSLSRFFKRHGITRKKVPATSPSRTART